MPSRWRLMPRKVRRTKNVTYCFPTAIAEELKEHWEQYGYIVKYREDQFPKKFFKKKKRGTEEQASNSPRRSDNNRRSKRSKRSD